MLTGIGGGLVQLEGLKAFVGADARWRPHSAQLLQHCITSQLQVGLGCWSANVLVQMQGVSITVREPALILALLVTAS